MSARRTAEAPVRPDPLSGYRPPRGVADELLDGAGEVRPAWRPFLRAIGALGDEAIATRFARGDQHLRDAGVYYRQYEASGSSERAWPLSHIPVMLDHTEWAGIERALAQRADLLETVVADLYGEARLVAGGHLPGSLIASSREWLRPLVGVRPASGHYLHFLAFEIGRGPDGTWWVMGDRTQAPSGSGFALENRIATSRVFPELFTETNVVRLAGFFTGFREVLRNLRRDGDGLAAILTPGILNDAYFEHAYIARYLGLMLLEGEDLAVERGRVMVRTVSGPKPVSVLWRRLDSTWTDPLELDERSRLGAPGLVEAVRSGGVTMVNALGTGVLEIRALMAFLPRIAESVLGEPLAMPNIATWWCGQEQEREHVAANADGLMIGSALATRLPFETGESALGTQGLRPVDAEPIDRWLRRDGATLVGQEAVTLSTTPTWENGRLVPRPMALRVFLVRTASGWRAMPGGYARIGRSEDTAAIALQRGGTVADVWVLGRERETAAATPSPVGAPYVRAEPAELPSRAADNLYWLGRYVERAETVMRLLRAYHVRLTETAAPEAPLLKALAKHLRTYSVDVEEPFPQGLLAVLGSALTSAGAVRDRFSEDGWMALTDLDRTAEEIAATVAPGDGAAQALSVLLRKATGFTGLVQDNMYRFTGWHFLRVGRAVERAIATAAVLARFADPAAPDGGLDLSIEIGDSVMAHRRRYAVATNRETVVDMLALDLLNPRGILTQLSLIRDLVDELPGAVVNGQMSALARAALETRTALAVHTPETLDTGAVLDVWRRVTDVSDLLTATYHR